MTGRSVAAAWPLHHWSAPHGAAAEKHPSHSPAASAVPLRLVPRLGPATEAPTDCDPGGGQDVPPVEARSPAGADLHGRVALVVDDEPMILEILAEHCASLGMAVHEAPGGEPALALIQQHPEIEVLVTDVRMPGLDGPALVERAVALRPALKVIFVTGYTTYRSSIWPTLRKPFDLGELDAALRGALLAPEGEDGPP